MPDVVDVYKAGGYGTTVWFHVLECGHIVTSRRRASKPSLPCVVCDQLASLPEDSDATTVVERDQQPEPVEVVMDSAAGDLEAESRVRAELAHRLHLPVESITVLFVNGVLEGALISLSAPQVHALLKQTG